MEMKNGTPDVPYRFRKPMIQRNSRQGGVFECNGFTTECKEEGGGAKVCAWPLDPMILEMEASGNRC